MSKRERNLVILMGVILVGGLAYLFLFVLGGEEPSEVTAPTPISSPPLVPTDPGIGVGEPDAEPPRAVTFFGGRDPFTPLVVATATDGGTTDGGTTDGGTTDGGTTDGGTTDGGTTDGGTTDDGTTDPDPSDDNIAVTGRPVVLVDVIDEQTVQVEVEGDPFTLTEGQRFARSYQVASVEARCARFLYGDESFTLCEGDPQK